MMLFKQKVKAYFADQYENTMTGVYQEARKRIAQSLDSGGYCLDCGSGEGRHLQHLNKLIHLNPNQYIGIDLNPQYLSMAKRDLQLLNGDLNHPFPFKDQSFQCVFALSVLEHLVYGCEFLREAHRVLKPGGHLVLVTPNMSAWFNVFLLAIGKMPSSGPHPDSIKLILKSMPLKFRELNLSQKQEDVPRDRHLVVFTYRVLNDFLSSLGFTHVEGKAYGYYPFPKILQRVFERLDPWHCHQMIFDCRR